ncbi:unconventional myosin-XVIIIa isoform X3 [Electrophorus electricus]|uniref:unconventional myosin-XVIIIa isoform X3 n=1 Tax=Electrophorus electricus TaxID=8005 RepID=UPI0015D01622|nr:unconventional myosin-XVIIIa isoform X3 [Electrophorus electricus]
MFHLIKKDKDKERDRTKKEKKDRMSQAELNSLEEVGIRRGFFNLNRGSFKRDSKAKLEISNPIPIKVVRPPPADLTLPDVQSEKDSSARRPDVQDSGACRSSDDAKTPHDTLASHKSSVKERAAKVRVLTKQTSHMGQIMKRFSFSQRSKEESPSEDSGLSGPNSATPSPKVEAKVIGHQNRYVSHRRAPLGKVQVPVLVDKVFPADLHLPEVMPPQVPEARELELQRRNTGDFGFSLRRTAMLDQRPDGTPCRHVVHFAEPGAGTRDVALGLVPGDRLVEINGHNVESKSRDEIVEMIRQSGDTVRLKVRPIVELSELSHSWLRNSAGTRRDAGQLLISSPAVWSLCPEALRVVSMAFSSRFSFWEKKVKDENTPGSKGPNSDSEGSTNGRAQSVADGGGGAVCVPVAGRRLMDSPSDQRGGAPTQDVSEAQGLAQRPLVRRAVRRVDPGLEEQPSLAPEHPRPTPVVTSVPKAQSALQEDDLAIGLTSLMGRGRTKDHRARSRAAERKEAKEEIEESQKPTEEVLQETPPAAASPGSSLLPPTPNPPKAEPRAPPDGFLPAQKPNPLATLAGFIQPAKPDLQAPAPGFIPLSKPSALTPPAASALPLKPDLPAPPVGFLLAPKRDPFAPVAGFIPRPKADPLAPPAGFIPISRQTAVWKPEVKVSSRLSAAPAGKLVPRAAETQGATTSEQQPLPRRGIPASSQAKAEDPVAVLQTAHAAACQAKVKTEDQIAAEQAWYSTEKVWLVHKDGFSLATQQKSEEGSVPEGKVKIRLENDGTLLEVDEEDVEKANPPALDRVEDLVMLPYLNESSVMHCLRQRYGANLFHTHTGPNMVVINPVSTPAMYSEKVMQMFKGCRREDVAPHIYGVAQAAYRRLLTTRQDQAIALLGRSGSGKTTNCQHLLQYLVSVAGSNGKVYSAEKWQAVYTILEAFGNCGTSMNANASRFSHLVSLDFDQAGQVASASVQTMLLERSRVTRHPEAETTFNVFYYLMAGADGSLKNELHFNHFAETSAFGIVPPSTPEDKQKAAQQFTKLQAAMKVLGISVEEQRACWQTLGAIYHLGAAGATKAGRRQFARHEWGQKASYLLGCTLEELSSSIFKPQARGSLPRTSSLRPGPEEPADTSGFKATAVECLEAMASGLYSEVFTLLISLINRALKSSQHSLCSILIVDTPGFQNPRQASSERGAVFEELCHNYAQERLQELFHERTFVQELERYKEENIDLVLDDMDPRPSLSVAVVDQASSQTLIRTPARTDEARGLLWLMEEEALQPGGSEDTLLDRLFSYYGPAEGESKGHTLLLRSERSQHFLLGHSHGTNWVEYDARGWLSHAKQNPASQNAANLLQNSQKKNISGLFAGRTGSSLVLSGSIAGLEGGSQLALRRATSMRKTFNTGVAAVKKKSLSIQIKLQVDALLDTVRKARVHFVHCLLPKADAVRGTGSPEAQAESGDLALTQLDVALLRAQFRGSQLLDALRIYRQGYPDHMVFSEFRRRFDVLAPHLTKKLGRNYIVKDEKRAVEELLESLELEKSSYHMGLSRLFFRAGTLAKLEELRDDQTRQNITLFQASCRGYLARQAFKKRKVQDLAIRCIQKNIKKNRGVKNWPWWKLFTTVRPLVEVQLTEEQIHGKDEEIQQLKAKLEKLEKERSELRLNTDRLESRVAELSTELTDERNTGESASRLLEAETMERLRLEKDMEEMQVKYETMKKQMESMEMEVMEARLIRASELNGQMKLDDDDDDDDDGGEWKLKYDRAIRETEFTKKRLQQEFDDKLDTEQQSKRHLERKLADLQADHEETQRALQQAKKKSQRVLAELQDTKLHLEGERSRNHELEKKQRKFDMEQSQAQDEVQRERSQREKLARDRDMMTGEMFTLRQQLQEKELELCGLNVKVEQLEAELHDLSSQEFKDEASLAKLKKQLRDLEAKVKDQEEELDEQAGTIQMLEQAKLRLEMEMERQRQTHSKEIESKDEEMEGIRQSCSKRLKQMEVQLEEEYDDKQRVLRERRDLETKLTSAQDQVSQRDVEAEQRLKKDLKRTKVLLADAQLMLDHLKSNAPSKREISQLKNQLEESEFTCAAAVKARKSMELEIEDLLVQMEDISKAKMALEEQLSRLQREKNDLQSRLEEDQEDVNELMKKHKAAVAQSTRDLAQISDLQAQLEEATKEKQELQDKLQSLQSQLEFQEQSMVEKSLVSQQEAKIRELESKLEYERTQVKRLETLVARLKENLEKMTEEKDQRISGENREKEQNKRMQRQIRDIKEEMSELAKKETEASRKKHELEMDIESLEAANQSLQADLKLAFKRIGDLQAAIEDEMESDDNDDLINSLQDMVTKYQKRKSKTGDDSDVDSEVEDRVDGVKSWLSKNKGSSKTLLDEGSSKTLSLKYPNAANADVKDVTGGKEGKEGWNGNAQQGRPVSVMSSLSYRKRSNLKDSIGGTGDESSLFSTLKEQPDVPDRSVLRKSKSKAADDLEDRCSVISQAYSEATSRARRGLERRWTKGSPESDKESGALLAAPSRTSVRRGLDREDDDVSTLGGYSLRRSTSWAEDGRSDYGMSGSPGTSRRSGGRSPGSASLASRTSLARSSRLSEFGVDDDDDDDEDSRSRSMAFSEGGVSVCSPDSLSHGLSAPGRARTSEDGSAADVKPVSHRNYLDPELEKAINEVLSFKPVKFQRRSLEDSDGDDEQRGPAGREDDRKAGRFTKSDGDDDVPGRSASGLRTSASGSALDRARSGSSYSSRSTSSRKGKKKKKNKKKIQDSESESSSSGSSSSEKRGKSSKRKGKKGSRKGRKKESESESSELESSESSDSSSSSGSTVSYRSSSSIKKGPCKKASDEERGLDSPERPASKKEAKKKKKMDSLVMKYLYRPDDD